MRIVSRVESRASRARGFRATDASAPLLTLGPRPFAAGFTMVEIAISLAIIGFALVAIIGVLPFGMTVQQQNREQTIINDDAAFWLQAIRTGALGINDLPYYVVGITNASTDYDPSGKPAAAVVNGYGPANGVSGFRLSTGERIIGLLSTPKYEALKRGAYRSNYVAAYVRALSGPVTDKPPQANADVLDMAFSYKMIVEIVPQQEIVPVATGFADRQRIAPPDTGGDTNAVSLLPTLQDNLYVVRLTFRWPLLPNGDTGRNVLSYQTMVGGQLVSLLDGKVPVYFFDPHTYAVAQ